MEIADRQEPPIWEPAYLGREVLPGKVITEKKKSRSRSGGRWCWCCGPGDNPTQDDWVPASPPSSAPPWNTHGARAAPSGSSFSWGQVPCPCLAFSRGRSLHTDASFGAAPSPKPFLPRLCSGCKSRPRFMSTEWLNNCTTTQIIIKYTTHLKVPEREWIISHIIEYINRNCIKTRWKYVGNKRSLRLFPLPSECGWGCLNPFSWGLKKNLLISTLFVCYCNSNREIKNNWYIWESTSSNYFIFLKALQISRKKCCACKIPTLKSAPSDAMKSAFMGIAGAACNEPVAGGFLL